MFTPGGFSPSGMQIGQVWQIHYRDENADDYHLILGFRADTADPNIDRPIGMCLYSSDGDVREGAINPIFASIFDGDNMVFTLWDEHLLNNPIPGW